MHKTFRPKEEEKSYLSRNRFSTNANVCDHIRNHIPPFLASPDKKPYLWCVLNEKTILKYDFKS